jgi:hypothetical protein
VGKISLFHPLNLHSCSGLYQDSSEDRGLSGHIHPARDHPRSTGILHRQKGRSISGAACDLQVTGTPHATSLTRLFVAGARPGHERVGKPALDHGAGEMRRIRGQQDSSRAAGRCNKGNPKAAGRARLVPPDRPAVSCIHDCDPRKPVPIPIRIRDQGGYHSTTEYPL